ncbi:MAG: hypothetical protein AAF802_13270 [Planctomycetota bacterium]
MFFRYNPYAEYNSSTPPRPLRIIFGFLIASGGLLGGMGHAVHDHHRAQVMKAEPQVLTWDQLVESGYGENPHVQLREIHIVDPYAEMDDWLGEEMDELMEDPFMGPQLSNFDLGPAEILPLNRAITERRVQLASGVKNLDRAFAEFDESGTVTGMVGTYTADHMVADVYAFCTGTPIEDLVESTEDPVYTIVPNGGHLNAEMSRNTFLGMGLALSLGLVMLGSGGPGMWCCWYAPLPSALSIIGYPMRYGRGNWGTRLVYIGIGGALIGYGIYMMHMLGNLGQAEGNPIFQSLGFASFFCGLGAVLAVPLQITARALHASVEGTPVKKEKRLSWEQACSLEPVVNEIEYADQPLNEIDTLPLSGKLKEYSQALTKKGFTVGPSMQWQRESGIAAATVQLGCQNMAITDLEYNNESDLIESAIISVLGTGTPIITLSANAAFKQDRPAPGVLIRKAESSEPAAMLSGHLDVVINEAEQRDTVVVEFLESEIQDVVHLARRALADAQGTFEGQLCNVGPQRYGRFHYPPAPVQELTVS